MVAHFCEYTKSSELYTLYGVILKVTQDSYNLYNHDALSLYTLLRVNFMTYKLSQ